MTQAARSGRSPGRPKSTQPLRTARITMTLDPEELDAVAQAVWAMSSTQSAVLHALARAHLAQPADRSLLEVAMPSTGQARGTRVFVLTTDEDRDALASRAAGLGMAGPGELLKRLVRAKLCGPHPTLPFPPSLATAALSPSPRRGRR